MTGSYSMVPFGNRVPVMGVDVVDHHRNAGGGGAGRTGR